jgi:hypothetical protein
LQTFGVRALHYRVSTNFEKKMARTGTRSGGAHQPSPVSRLVSSAISNVKKRLKAERLKAERAKKQESERKRRERELQARAKLRLEDAEVVDKLLAMGKCAVRFKMRGAVQLVRDDWTPIKERRESMRETSWVFCSACDDLGRHAWHNPRAFCSVKQLDSGRRHTPFCVHNGACSASAGVRIGTTFRQLKIMPRFSYSALEMPLLASPPPPPPPPAEPGRLLRRDPTFPACLRHTCARDPAVIVRDAALDAARRVADASEDEYAQESPLERALRQKAHCRKDVLAMGDDVFYKHLRDHNVEPDEAFGEVLKRKRLIHAGESDAYEPPEIGHLILGLHDGVSVPDPAPPLVIAARDEADVYAPWILNPWQTYLDQKSMANSGVVQAMQAIAVF